MLQSPPVVLTIAGFDPSSGAGITADIKTIAAHGCYGVAAITAMTVQSTSGVRTTELVSTQLLRETLDTLEEDVKIVAVHIGMLGSKQTAETVAAFLIQKDLPNIVLDTILTATSGAKLLDDDAIEILKEQLMPLAAIVTPNAHEAGVLTEIDVESLDEMQEATEKLAAMGAKAVLVTGGHLNPATDVLRLPDGDTQTFKSEQMDAKFTHGTGCALSTSIACYLAQGRPLPEAVLLAKAYVTAAINNGYPIGKGINPVNHMYRLRNHPGGFAKKLVSGKD